MTFALFLMGDVSVFYDPRLPVTVIPVPSGTNINNSTLGVGVPAVNL